jgi:membrane-bound ClpP family serine protease
MGWVGPGIGGVVLILIGLVLLAQNLGAQLPDNWWAAFLMIPAVGAFVAATNQYRETGKFTGEGIAALIGGVVLTALAVSFYFDFGWGLFWPLILVAIGAGILFRTYWR